MKTKNNYIVDIVIVSYKNPDITIQCVNSIKKTTKCNYNILVIDNASPDNTVEVLKNELPGIQIIENEKNKGYSGAINEAARYCDAPFLLVSNNDVVYRDNVIDSLVEFLKENDDIAVTGPGQEYADGSFEMSSGDLPVVVNYSLETKTFELRILINLFAKLSKKLRIKKEQQFEVGYIDGAVMLIRRNVFDELSGFDEDYDFYSEEADFCYRAAKAGFRIVSNIDTTVIHYRGVSNKSGHLNKKSIKKLVSSKVLFGKKHFTKTETGRYIKTEKLYSYLVSKAAKLLSFITFGRLREKLRNKAQIMDSFYRSWSHELKKFYD